MPYDGFSLLQTGVLNPKLLMSADTGWSITLFTISLGNITRGFGHGFPGASCMWSHINAVDPGTVSMFRNNNGFFGFMVTFSRWGSSPYPFTLSTLTNQAFSASIICSLPSFF